MLDAGLLEQKGARAETKYTDLATIKFIAGLQTQRSPLAAIDTRYGTRFMGGKPDALIAGSNVEVSNSLTLQRRPGLLSYGVTSIPPPLTFYEWETVDPFGLMLMVDTAASIYNYSPTYDGIYVNKSDDSGQTSFLDLINTLYFGDGVDRYKITGPNLLVQSNTFSSSVWAKANVVLTPGQSDPVGGADATRFNWVFASGLSNIQQMVVPNYTPVPNNTFTASIWLRVTSGSESVTLQLVDQVNSVVAQAVIGLSTTWMRYQVTGTTSSGASTSGQQSLTFVLTNPSAVTAIDVYGGQLEVGGPAAPTQVTTIKAQGVYLWGIEPPVNPPTWTANAVGTIPINLVSISRTAASSFVVARIIDSPTSGSGIAAGTKILIAGVSDATLDGTFTVLQVVQLGPSKIIYYKQAGADSTILVSGTLTPLGLSPAVGYQWHYAYLNSVTGQPSNVSPISSATGVFSSVEFVLTGIGSADPQVDQIALYRNIDGGAFFYQLDTIPNPGATTWTYTDVIPDGSLNTQIFAPIGFLNTRPPLGAVDPVFHANRVWVHVNNVLYYSAGADNAAVINVILNAVSAESFPPANNLPFNAPVIRKISTSAGLLVWTTKDLWLVTGTDINSPFNAVRILAGHGLRSWNAMDVDGSNIYAVLSDRETVTVTPGVGSLEVGYPIGDLLEELIDPALVYVTRHIAGSRDNAVFIADGSTGWFRLNPNQVGASLSGEQTEVWSPFATIVGGCGAVSSIETSPGVHKLLVGQVVEGPVLVRDLDTFTDNGSAYSWSANLGSMVLADSGTLAEVESITTETRAANGTIPTVGVILDEITGSFEILVNSVNDPPQLVPSTSLLSRRFYLSQGTEAPLCKHLQISLSGGATATKDELLSLGIRGILVPEQQ